MVIALAGRRIDPENAAAPRFPPANEAAVQAGIRRMMEDLGAKALVSSAACGADILALEAAAEAGLRRRVILPFDRFVFRKTSVIDRPGDWGARFDQQLEDAEIVELHGIPGEDSAYAAANHAIFEEAMAVAADTDQAVTAVIVWNGQPRGDSDLTAAFRDEALRRGLPVVEQLTI